MTAKELLDLNGDFRSSPLLDMPGRLHRVFEEKQIPYAVAAEDLADLVELRKGST